MKIVVLFLFFLYPSISQSWRTFDANGNLIHDDEKKEVVYEIVQPDGRISSRSYMPTGNFKEIKQYDNGNKHVIQLRVQEEIQAPLNPLSYDANMTTTTINKKTAKHYDIPSRVTTLRKGEIKLLPIEEQRLIMKKIELRKEINTSIQEQESIENEKDREEH